MSCIGVVQWVTVMYRVVAIRDIIQRSSRPRASSKPKSDIALPPSMSPRAALRIAPYRFHAHPEALALPNFRESFTPRRMCSAKALGLAM